MNQILLGLQGRFDEAIAAGNTSVEFGPARLVVVFGSGSYISACAGSLRKAIEQFRKTLEIDPRRLPSRHVPLSQMRTLCAGQREKAIEECDQALALTPQVMTFSDPARPPQHMRGSATRTTRANHRRKLEKTWKAGADRRVLVLRLYACMSRRQGRRVRMAGTRLSGACVFSLLSHVPVHPCFAICTAIPDLTRW